MASNLCKNSKVARNRAGACHGSHSIIKSSSQGFDRAALVLQSWKT